MQDTVCQTLNWNRDDDSQVEDPLSLDVHQTLESPEAGVVIVIIASAGQFIRCLRCHDEGPEGTLQDTTEACNEN